MNEILPGVELVNYGAFAIMLVLILTGQLVVKKQVDDLREDRDRYRDLVESMTKSLGKLPDVQDTILHTVKMILRLLEELTRENRESLKDH